MINKICSMPSAEALIKARGNIQEYVRACSVLPKLPETKVALVTPEYTSPFAPIISNLNPKAEMPVVSHLDIFG